jgi:predicted dehydrogenase
MTDTNAADPVRRGDPIRWGILGARADIFVKSLEPPMLAGARHDIVARASRAADGGDAPYADLLARDDVEAVYIPLPNGLHRVWVERALAAGKHVLCEKPLGMDEAEAASMYDAAEAAGRVLVEAYAPPYHPATQLVEQLVAAGELGELLFAHHVFNYVHRAPDTDHRFDPVLGNGSLLDLGCYVIGPLLALAGTEPQSIEAVARYSPPRPDRGSVESSLSGWFDFGTFRATIESSMEAPHRRIQELAGTGGTVRRERAWFPFPEDVGVTVVRPDDSVQVFEHRSANAYREMIDEFAAVVRDGAPLRFGRSESLRLARTIDRVLAAAERHRAGSVHP